MSTPRPSDTFLPVVSLSPSGSTVPSRADLTLDTFDIDSRRRAGRRKKRPAGPVEGKPFPGWSAPLLSGVGGGMIVSPHSSGTDFDEVGRLRGRDNYAKCGWDKVWKVFPRPYVYHPELPNTQVEGNLRKV